CPGCGGDLALHSALLVQRHIEEGTLECRSCGASYPIEHGVPVFVPDQDRRDVVQTTSGFARNWDEYNDVILQNEELNDELFRDWISPVDPNSFAGKLVLEPGCGMGRWLRIAARYSPRTLIGVDYSSIAYTAARNVREMENVHVIRADIHKLPLKKRIEWTYCLGVVHHTPEPEKTFDALVSVLGPAGRMTVWVYGKEGNRWIHALVTPLRKHVTSRLPHGVLGIVSTALALPLFAAARLSVRVPLPYREYLQYLARYPFRYMSQIVYYHLAPEIAHYLSRDEVEGWARKHGLHYHLAARNGNSWRLLTNRVAEAARLEKTGS